MGDPWGPDQATGAPNTLEAEDAPTAWCPLTPDSGPEWLALQFEKAVTIAEVRIVESFNPGAVTRVAALLDDGSEAALWEGVDPTREAPGTFAVAVQGEVQARMVVIHLDTARAQGFNAIDAVELVGRDGSRQWASHAAASSTYATAGALLANEFSEEARVFDDHGVRGRAPGWWIRANPALLTAPGEILRAWTRDGTAAISVSRLETGSAWSPRDLLDRTAAALESILGAEIQAREVHDTGGMRAMGLVATGTDESGEGPRTTQHWVVVPRTSDVLVFLLSTPESRFASDDRVFGKRLAALEIQGTQTAAQRAAK